MDFRDVAQLGEAVLAGHRLSHDDALALTRVAAPDIPLLAAYANKIRHTFSGDGVDMCGIISARSGRCSEDCKFCAQSAHYTTSAPVYPLLDSKAIIAAARRAQVEGAKRVSVVTSGKSIGQADFDTILSAIEAVIAATGLQVCANLGTVTEAQCTSLAKAGIDRYAHNLETSRRFYPAICTTHSYEERVRTANTAQAAGLELCSGGIIGMGETWQDRVELAFSLLELSPVSVPINILVPVKGTPLEERLPPTPLEVVKTFAIFRFILPDKIIRPAGGREANLRDMQGFLMLSGANGLIIGNYLTFGGRDAATDFRMVADAGLYQA